ncbi:hypothetical protein SCAR479_11675 [Seiridium cardinale]|uniref:Uncharacterized protein n=1 Tax=Seiridium cardinale TaxID=138064 RepID=A0ABR2XCU3_9PEZI
MFQPLALSNKLREERRSEPSPSLPSSDKLSNDLIWHECIDLPVRAKRLKQSVDGFEAWRTGLATTGPTMTLRGCGKTEVMLIVAKYQVLEAVLCIAWRECVDFHHHTLWSGIFRSPSPKDGKELPYG